MSNSVLIIGQSGTGKSTSIRNLDPASTFIINVLDKPLPFKGYKKSYTPCTKENKNGNYYSSDNWAYIVKAIEAVNETRPEISTLIIDDWQYVMANEFMNRVHEKGFDKYSELGAHAWAIVNTLSKCRNDLTSFILSHSEIDNVGRAKLKTIGRLLDEKITIEGMFTVCLHSRIIDQQYKFQTQNDGEYTCKSPIGMFDSQYIDNDLLLVKKAIEEYNN